MAGGLHKASAVHKGELLDFCNLCVRDVYSLQQLTIVAGMGPQHLEVPREVKCSNPCGSEAALRQASPVGRQRRR